MSTRYLVKLTMFERKQLLKLIAAMEASEWSAGDYCLTQAQFNALLCVKAKLQS